MAQLPGSPRSDEYAASAGQTVFIYTYRIHSDEEIAVSQNGTLLTLTIDYTVQDAGEPTGGTITLVTPALDGDIMVLAGNTLIQRITEFQNNGDFLASAINGEYNVLDDITSELLTTGTGGFHLDTPSVLIDTGVPTPAPRRCLVWNDAGDKIEMSTYDPDLGQAEAAASAAEAAISAGEALASAGGALVSEIAAAASAVNAEYWASQVDMQALATDIIPATDILYDIGSPTYAFQDLHINDGYIYDALEVGNSITAGGLVHTSDVLQAGPDVGYTFKVDVTAGTVEIDGNLDVNSNFSVDAATGNTIIDGTLTVGGLPINAVTRFKAIDEREYNIDGGTFVAGAWQTRVLNTVTENTIVGASLNSNQVTLPAGSYHYSATMPASNIDGHIGVLYNITLSERVGEKICNSNSYASVDTYVTPSASFTITEECVFELWHICKTTANFSGFGHRIDIVGQPSTFSTLEIIKY